MDKVFPACPCASAAEAAGEAFVVLADVPGVGAGIQEIDAGVQGTALFSAPLRALSHIDQLGGHIALETGPEVVSALESLNLDEAAGEVTMLHGGDAAHHFHGFDVFRADGAHICAQVHIVGAQAAPGGGILQVGIVLDWLSVNGKLGSEGRCGIVRRQGTGRPQVHGLRRAQCGGGGAASGKKLQDVGDAGRLDVRDGFGPYPRRGGETVVFLRRNHHFAKG